MINPAPPTENRALRITLTLVAIGVSAGLTAWLGQLSEGYPTMRTVRQHWLDTGSFMILFFAIAVPVGTLLHTAPAAAAGVSVRRGWENAARLLAYGVLVAAVAWLVAPLSPDAAIRRTRHDASGIYPAWLACVLLTFAVLACAGGLFVRPRPRPEDPTDFSPPRSEAEAAESRPAAPATTWGLDRALFTTGLLAWMIGGPLLVLLLILGLVNLIAR
ncbi:hypothetical protein V6U81_05235 [Micromonospora sp. CPCC 205711]|uniref:hypothetical protein n=1 Tax=Micromonospora sp. CPCC 205547 TaxID=3122400 RepID=UPI002FF30AB3